MAVRQKILVGGGVHLYKKLRNQTLKFSKIHKPNHHERLFHDQHASDGLQSPRESAAGEEGGVLGVEAVVHRGAAGDLESKIVSFDLFNNIYCFVDVKA